MPRRRRRDRGIALLLVLLVLAVIIVIIGQMSASSLHNRTVVENNLSDLQNTYGARSGYYKALLYLQADLEKAPDVDAPNEKWAQPLEFELGRSRVRVTVRDAERCVNLSRLVNDKGEVNAVVAAQLHRLVRFLRHPPDAADRIIDFIDGDNRGAYERGARNARLFSVDELLQVDGLPREVLYGGMIGGEEKKGLLDFITIWPRKSPEGAPSLPGTVNANTAPVEVIMALSDKMTPGVAEAIVAHRMAQQPDGRFQSFTSVQDVRQVSGMNDEIFLSISTQLAVRSEIFEVQSRSSSGNIEKAWVYVVHRAKGAKKLTLLASHRVNDFLSVRLPEEEEDP